MKKETQDKVKPKMPVWKKVLLFTGIPIAPYIILYFVVIFVLAGQVPSSKSQLYSGPGLTDSLQQPLRTLSGIRPKPWMWSTVLTAWQSDCHDQRTYWNRNRLLSFLNAKRMYHLWPTVSRLTDWISC